MRNWLSRAALIGALCAGSACTALDQSAVTADQRAAQPAASAPDASTFSLRASSANAVRADHYEVPPDYDNDATLHPYTSGLGPCPHGGPGKQVCGELVPPSRYSR